VNAPGTVDAGYRGEIKVCLINTDRRQPISIARGDRIAQLVIQPVSVAAFVPVTELPSSSRGIGGYGSTGGILGPAEYWAVPNEGQSGHGPPSEGTRA
jgi:dUTP pyrophosphatase